MRRSFITLLLMLSLLGTAQAATQLQSRSVAGTGFTDTTAIAYSNSLAAGSLLVMACGVSQSTFSSANPTFSDSKGNTWAVSSNVGMNDAGSVTERLYVGYAINTGGSGADTVTVNPPGSSTFASCILVEYEGMTQVGVLDKTVQTNSAAGSTSVSSGTTAPTVQAAEIVLGAMSYNSSTTTITEQAPCILVGELEDNNTYQSIAVCAYTTSSPGTQQAQWILGGTGPWAASAQTFKIASVATPGAVASYFNGLTSMIQIPSQAAISSTAFTVSCWTRFEGNGEAGFGRMMEKDLAWAIRHDAVGTYRLTGVGWSTTDGVWTWPGQPINSWAHIAVSYDGSSPTNQAIGYLAGVAQTTTTNVVPVGTYTAGTGDLFIGNDALGTRTWDGQLAECFYYSRVLAAEEISEIYARGPNSSPRSLIGYWPLGVFGARNYTSTPGLNGAATAVTLLGSGPPISYASQGDLP